VKVSTANVQRTEEITMNNTPDELIESLVAATAHGEIKWDQNVEEIRAALQETYGEVDDLYTFLDEEAGAYVVLASYQYAVGQEGAESYIDGTSLLLVDSEDYEVLNEVTDEDVADEEIFKQLFSAIAGN
jgi:hypothetical protein